MAISPPGDIVLDVARAVEPIEFAAARTRLAQRAGSASEAVFQADIREPATSLPNTERPVRAAERPDPLVKFEAMVLQTFIQSMLPKEAESVYGKGVAGEMWQSLLSEKLGETLAARGGIGIADKLLRDYHVEGERQVPLGAISGGAESPEQADRKMLADALVEKLQSTLTGSLHEQSGENES